MQRIFNKTENIVSEMLKGMSIIYPELIFDEQKGFITRKNISCNKVTVIAVGSAGHEPGYIELIGKGMLDGVILGDIFTAPTVQQIYNSVKDIETSSGVVLLTQNFSRHIYNIQRAVKLIRKDGINVKSIVVSDDLSAKKSPYSMGSRGSTGIVFAYKLAGAASDLGMNIIDTVKIVEEGLKGLYTINFAVKSHISPITNLPTFLLKNGEVEYGVGIHGEAGIERFYLSTADELAVKLVNDICNFIDTSNSEIAVLINGFSNTSLMELYVLANSIDSVVMAKNISTYKTFVGSFFGSISMTGGSLTILKLDSTLKKLIAHPCDTRVYKFNEFIPDTRKVLGDKIDYDLSDPRYKTVIDNKITFENIIYMIDTMGYSIIKNELFFYELGFDELVTNLSMGFKDIKKSWNNLLSNNRTISSFLVGCSDILNGRDGGMLCDIWSFGLRYFAERVSKKSTLSLQDFINIIDMRDLPSKYSKQYAFLKNKDLVISIGLIFSYVKRSLSNNLKQGESTLDSLRRGVGYCRRTLNISLFGSDVRVKKLTNKLSTQDIVNYIIMVILSDVLDSMM